MGVVRPPLPTGSASRGTLGIGILPARICPGGQHSRLSKPDHKPLQRGQGLCLVGYPQSHGPCPLQRNPRGPLPPLRPGSEKEATPLAARLAARVDAIITRQLGNDHKLATLPTCFRITLMYEGCLRWYDLDQICFGDIIVSATYLRIFVQSAETDAYRLGQWVTIAVSDPPTEASTLLMQVLEALALLWRAITQQTRKLLGENLVVVLQCGK